MVAPTATAAAAVRGTALGSATAKASAVAVMAAPTAMVAVLAMCGTKALGSATLMVVAAVVHAAQQQWHTQGREQHLCCA
jgi:hypothetical protein